MKKTGMLIVLVILIAGVILMIKNLNVGIRNVPYNAPLENETTVTTTQTDTLNQSQTISNNWRLGWDASNPITINGKNYIVKGATFNVNYRISKKPEHRMIIEKEYSKVNLNGEDVYRLSANLTVDGEKYQYIVYIHPNYLEDYTTGILWVPSIYDMINSEGIIKLEIAGPSCHYSMSEDGSFEGDTTCGTTNIDPDFQKYNTIWSFPTGFYGGIYSDVLTWVTLTENGDNYTVRPGDTTMIGNTKFDTYNITWKGIVQSNLAQAKGETTVSPELPFPVQVTASLTMPNKEEVYIQTKLTDLQLKSVD